MNRQESASFFPQKLKALFFIFAFIGLVSFVVGLAFMDKQRVWSAFLVSSTFVFFLSLGGVFFTAIQHVTKAVWSVNLRRLMEAFGIYIPIGCLMALLLVVAGESLYIWMNPEIVSKDPLLSLKAAYLNRPFFILRLLICSGLWIGFSKWLINCSLRQDQTESEALMHKSFKISVAFLAVFALTFTVFTIDTLMSLEPHWYSTIFGVYCFVGLFQAFIAALVLLTVYSMRKGVLGELVNENHLHDLGKFLFGCTILWAYIAFSQYMLVWYTNLPEEAVYFHHRTQHSWMWVSVSLIIFKFIVPFLFLLPRWVKRDATSMVLVSVLILIMQYVDIYWMVYPNYDPHHIRFGLLELGLLLGFIGGFLLSLFHFLSSHPLTVLKDPGREESASHVVHY